MVYLIVVAIIALLLSRYIFFPKARIWVLLGGIFGGWIEDKSKTPEGAKAIWNKEIEEKKKDYTKANDILRSLVGRKSTLEREIAAYNEELTEVERNCEALAKQQKWEDLEVIAERRDEILSEINSRKKILEETLPQIEEAKMINDTLETQIRTLEREKNDIIRQIIAKKQISEIYDEMDELKNISTSNKMMKDVRKGVEELTEKAEGAKALYNNKASTKYNKAMEKAKGAISSQYVDELKSKYAKTSVKTSSTTFTTTKKNDTVKINV